MNKVMVWLIVIATVGAGVVLFGTQKVDMPLELNVADIPDTSASQEKSISVSEKRITISEHKIQNGIITVPVGSTVVFENTDSFEGLPYSAHTVVTGIIDSSGKTGVPGEVPNSGSGIPNGLMVSPLGKDDIHMHTFNEVGTVKFYVAEHPNISGQAVVTVTSVGE